ncbi:MAG: 50S ribosomal protein L4 [Candidatus Nomurabacteria bacterium]|nr:MAG: 50S ribosomal protein L4 [Candidatus Nomurabacteria bacterium]
MEKVQTTIHGKDGAAAGNLDLDPSVFGIEWNDGLIYQVVRVQQLNRRQPVAHTKTRAEVSGGGKKPWRQKGTGRARHGSIRSPIWVGGGVAFGPRNTRVYALKVNTKARRKAIRMALSAKLQHDQMYVIDDLQLDPMKTKTLADLLKTHKLKKVTLVPPQHMPELRRIAKNMPNVNVIRADSLNTVDILNSSVLLMPKQSVEVIEKTFRPKE